MVLLGIGRSGVGIDECEGCCRVVLTANRTLILGIGQSLGHRELRRSVGPMMN